MVINDYLTWLIFKVLLTWLLDIVDMVIYDYVNNEMVING